MPENYAGQLRTFSDSISVKIFLLCCTIATLFGCAYCKDAANPITCNAKYSLGAFFCLQEAERKTPIIKTATGNYICDGWGSGNVGSSGNVSISTHSTCGPEVIESQDRAIIDMYYKACMKAKLADGRFKR